MTVETAIGAAPAAGGRQGPRPLPAHLGAALAVWTSSVPALMQWRRGSLPWRADLAPAAAALQSDARGVPTDSLAPALAGEAHRRLTRFLAGIDAYRVHPYRRALADPPVLWRGGSARLFDVGALAPGAADGAPVLLVPSLVNRSYILDLSPERSLTRHLAGRGLRPFLVDWGAPGPAEDGFDIAAYVRRRLEPALDAVAAACGRPPVVAGYCMGGLLALALAARRPADIAGLALLATPWDFHADAPFPPAALAYVARFVETVSAALDALPVDLLQLGFLALDPMQAARKFAAFADRDPAAPETAHYVAVEDWVNDGVPLAAGVARDCLQGWYVDNAPARGAWRVAGTIVDPAAVPVPALVALPRRDRLVPYASAAALADALPAPHRLEVESGHTGMIVGARAASQLWHPLAAWLTATAG